MGFGVLDNIRASRAIGLGFRVQVARRGLARLESGSKKALGLFDITCRLNSIDTTISVRSLCKRAIALPHKKSPIPAIESPTCTLEFTE